MRNFNSLNIHEAMQQLVIICSDSSWVVETSNVNDCSLLQLENVSLETLPANGLTFVVEFAESFSISYGEIFTDGDSDKFDRPAVVLSLSQLLIECFM